MVSDLAGVEAKIKQDYVCKTKLIHKTKKNENNKQDNAFKSLPSIVLHSQHPLHP